MMKVGLSVLSILSGGAGRVRFLDPRAKAFRGTAVVVRDMLQGRRLGVNVVVIVAATAMVLLTTL